MLDELILSDFRSIGCFYFKGDILHCFWGDAYLNSITVHKTNPFGASQLTFRQTSFWHACANFSLYELHTIYAEFNN